MQPVEGDLVESSVTARLNGSLHGDHLPPRRPGQSQEVPFSKRVADERADQRAQPGQQGTLNGEEGLGKRK